MSEAGRYQRAAPHCVCTHVQSLDSWTGEVSRTRGIEPRSPASLMITPLTPAGHKRAGRGALICPRCGSRHGPVSARESHMQRYPFDRGRGDEPRWPETAGQRAYLHTALSCPHITGRSLEVFCAGFTTPRMLTRDGWSM